MKTSLWLLCLGVVSARRVPNQDELESINFKISKRGLNTDFNKEDSLKSWARAFNLELDDSYQYEHKQIASAQVTVARAMINGIPAYGNELIFAYNPTQNYLLSASLPHRRLHKRDILRVPPAPFLVTEEQAIHLLRNDMIHRGAAEGFKADKIYLAMDKQLTPVWRIIDSSALMQDRQVAYVNAIDGKIISKYSLVHHDDEAFVFPPGSGSYSIGKSPTRSTIPKVITNNTRNGGRGIYGQIFRSYNSCKYFQCVDGKNGTCDEDNSICLGNDESVLVGQSNYHTIDSWFISNGKYIDVDRDWEKEGYKDGKIYMKWLNAPAFGPKISKPNDAVWGSDVDFSTFSPADKQDAFAELQVYYLFNRHHSFMSGLLNNTSENGVCLVGDGPSCTSIDPISNVSANKWSMPFRYSVNLQQIQSPDPQINGYPTIIDQIAEGKGKESSNPVIFPSSQKYADAFFSGSFSVVDVNRNCSYDRNDPSQSSCLSIFDAVMPFISFGQSDTDWALNDCIAFHELTHAFVFKINPFLATYAWTEDGLLSDPGAMNEAWADYFAAISCGVPNFAKDTYNKRPGRSIVNENTCQDMIGQVHTDSLVFSGALWKIRNEIPKTAGLGQEHQTTFDKIILQALALSTAEETMKSQMLHILNLLQANFDLSRIYSFAKNEFDRRILNCNRVMLFKDTMDPSLILPSSGTTRQNVSLIPSQVKFEKKASDWELKLTWNQRYISPVLGSLDYGYAKKPLSYVFSFDCPISIEETTRTSSGFTTPSNKKVVAIAKCADGSQRELSWEKTEYDAVKKTGIITIPLPKSSTGVYVFFGHQYPAMMVLGLVNTSTQGFDRIWLISFVVIGFLNFLQDLVFIPYLIVARKTSFRNMVRRSNLPFVLSMVIDFIALIASAIMALITLSVIYIRDKGYLIAASCQLALFGSLLLYLIATKRENKFGKYRWLNFSSSFFCLAILLCFIFTFVRSVPIWAHGIVYAIYIISFASRSFFKWKFGLSRV